MGKANYQSVAFFLFAMCIFTGCTRKGSGNIANETKAEDSVSFVSESDSCKQPTAQDFLKKQLLGVWALGEVAWQRITEDSIYFIDEEGEPAIKYSVRGDTIIMYFDDFDFVKKDKFWITDDTLFVENKSGDGGCGHFERIR